MSKKKTERAAGAKAKCTLLDHHHDLTPHEAAFKDGKLELVKPDFHSAAFFVEFVKCAPRLL